MEIVSYRDLRVWQGAMDLVEDVYRLTKGFPQHETFGLAAHAQRAVVSIPSNIAEGHAREHRKEYLQHLSVAQGSLAEVETHLEITARLEYASRERIRPLFDRASSLGRQLHALRNALRKKPLRHQGRSPSR